LWFVVLASCEPGEPDGRAPRDGTEPPASGDTADTEPPPGADLCNNRDDDLDGQVDEDGLVSWYLDVDNDGFGDPETTVSACDPGTGWTRTPGDCDDNDGRLADVVDPVRSWVDRSEARGFTALGRTWDGVRSCLRDSLGGGMAVADLDGDGHEDVFVAGTGVRHKLMRGDGRGGFTASELDLAPIRASGASPIDVDGDGDLDLVVGTIGREPVQLLMNDGDARFTEEAQQRGVALVDDAGGCGDWFGASAADLDGDGDLDLMIGGWEDGLALGRRTRSRLLVNTGGGYFVDQTVTWGVDALWDRAVFSGMFTDVDRDGDPDMLAIADWNGTTTLENVGGRFVLTPDESVFTDDNGMGADLGDPDNDGDLDWFLTSIWADPYAGCSSNPASLCSGNRLYGWNQGGWIDATDAAGVREGQWAWGTAFFDWDLDGAEDLVFTGGFDSLLYRDAPGGMYHNRGDGTFEDWTCRANFTWKGLGRGVLPFDADEDGDEDLVLSARLEGMAYYELVGPPGHALHLELRQPGANPFAIGAMVRVYRTASSAPQVALVHANPHYTSGQGPWVHLGLGTHTEAIDHVEVTWPDGRVTRFDDVPQGRVVLRR
jgi:hypothetical protein